MYYTRVQRRSQYRVEHHRQIASSRYYNDVLVRLERTICHWGRSRQRHYNILCDVSCNKLSQREVRASGRKKSFEIVMQMWG